MSIETRAGEHATTGLQGVFYGYWVLAAGFTLCVVHGGLYFYGFGSFFKTITEELGTSRAVLSGAFSLARLEGGLIGPLEGWLIDRFGPRKVLLTGIPIMAAGFALMSFVNSVAMFYVVFILCLSFGSSLSSVAPASAAVVNWFQRKRSRMLGIMLAGNGLGSVMVPVVTVLIIQLGWRQALQVLGALVLVAGLPLALVMRHKPEQYGYLPDGDTVAPPAAEARAAEAGAASDAADTAGGPDAEDGLTAREALRTPAFWLMSFAFSIRVGVTGSVALHFIPFLTDIGVGLGTAGLMVTAIGVVGITGRLAFGWLGDLFPKRYVATGGLCSLALGLVVLAFADSLWQVALALVLYAPAYGGLATMMFAMRSEYFGRKSFATIQGFMGSVLVLGTVSGPIYAGWIFDVTHSYRIAFLTFAAASALAILLILAAKPLRPRPAATPATA
ncbi:MAG: MFS transporter [Dehalococcoidia bacterium]|nr:MFS transporter [Dehalococcoidia bacterium]